MKNLKKHLRVWVILSKNSFLAMTNQKVGFLIFFVGKLLRFFFFVLFLSFILNGAGSLAGYGRDQTLFFVLTFGFLDAVSQFLFREVYRFRQTVVTGSFDITLSKPISPLFKSLLSGADAIDFATLPILFVVLWSIGARLDPSFSQVFLYAILLINGLLISAAFHIVVLALGIITFEIDHTIMIYRDISSLGRFPIDVYKEPVKSVLTYIVPVGVMVGLPAKAFLGLVTPQGVVVSLILGAISIFVALRFWKYALKFYTSASS